MSLSHEVENLSTTPKSECSKERGSYEQFARENFTQINTQCLERFRVYIITFDAEKV